MFYSIIQAACSKRNVIRRYLLCYKDRDALLRSFCCIFIWRLSSLRYNAHCSRLFQLEPKCWSSFLNRTSLPIYDRDPKKAWVDDWEAFHDSLSRILPKNISWHFFVKISKNSSQEALDSVDISYDISLNYRKILYQNHCKLKTFNSKWA